MLRHLFQAVVFIALATVVGCSSCTDASVEGNNGTQDCPVGEEYNPVTGECAPRTVGGNNGDPDLGGANDGGSDAGADDMGGGTDMATDASEEEDLPTDCQGTERRCNGDTVEVCEMGMFAARETCQSGFVCERGNCIPEDSGGCTPGERRCAGMDAYEECQSDGMTWGQVTNCAMDETCSMGVCTSGCSGLINEKSNVGCEYVSMRHDQATGLQTLPHTVVVSNPGMMPVDVQVDSVGGTPTGIGTQTIQPLDSAVLNFPTSPMISQSGTSQNIYLIQSSRPVIATQFSPLNNPGLGSETSDASLLLPTNAIGREYVVIGWRSLQPGGTYVDVVAFEADTTVTVESPLPLSGGSAGNVPEDGSNTFTLQAETVLHLAENRSLFDTGSRDVSGVRVSANKDVAVFTGATIVNIPDEPVEDNPPQGCSMTGSSCVSNDDCCSGLCGYDNQSGNYACFDSFAAGDHVEQQMFPVESWGTSYVATPFTNRSSNDFNIYRVVAANDNTTVTLDPPVDGVTNFTLNRGEFEQIYATEAFELTATQPVTLAHFMIGGQNSAAGDGDPAFLIPPAIQQYRDTYVFLVPGNYNSNYVTLIKTSGTQITLDGNAVPQSEFQAVGGMTNWEYAIVDSVSAGVHRASSSQPFGVVVHGMDFYISYAFAGGIILPN